MSGYTSGGGDVVLYDPSGNPIGSNVAADAADNNRELLASESRLQLFNETTWDRGRGNTEITVLAPAVRISGLSSPMQTNYNHRGLMVELDVTVNPGGGETLTLVLIAAMAGSSGIGYTIEQIVLTAATNNYGIICVGPGVTQAFIEPPPKICAFRATVIPRSWYVLVAHSGIGAWTYAVRAAMTL